MKWLVWFDLPVLLGFAAAIVLYGWASDARHVIGMVVAAIGFAFWLTARLQLGKSFAILAKAQALVTTGLYSKFRNPVYLFGGLAYAGLLIALGQGHSIDCLFSPPSVLPIPESQKRGAGPRKYVWR